MAGKCDRQQKAKQGAEPAIRSEQKHKAKGSTGPSRGHSQQPAKPQSDTQQRTKQSQQPAELLCDRQQGDQAKGRAAASSHQNY